MTQATGPTTSELAAVAYARKALKNTLSAAFLAYQKSNESLLKEREIKEVLFEALTIDKADDIAIEIDQDDEPIPDRIEDLKGMFKELILEHEKSKKQQRTTSSVKDNRGATNTNSKEKTRKAKAK